MKLNIYDTNVTLLYEPGSKVTLMTKQVYDSLKNKLPFQSINKSGTGVNGSTFKFDGIVYLSIKFPKSQSAKTLEYILELNLFLFHLE